MIWLYVVTMSRTRLAEWLSVRVRTKWFWVRIPLQSLKCYDLFKIHKTEIDEKLVFLNNR